MVATTTDAEPAEQGPFGCYALAIFDAGFGEVFPVRLSQTEGKKPRAWDKSRAAFDLPSEDGRWHSVTAREHEPITRDRVEQWVRDYPNDQIGLIPAPGLVVVDIDQHDEKEGAKALAQALGMSGKGKELSLLLRGTLHVSARDGARWESLGGHWFFTVPDGTRLKRAPVRDVEIIGPGRQGFYVVAVGSMHLGVGQPYRADVSGIEVPVEELSRSQVRPMPPRLLEVCQDDEERLGRPAGGGMVEDAEPVAHDPWGEPDEAVGTVLATYLDDLGDYDGEGTHHASAMRVQLHLVHLAESGHAGVWTALSEAGGAAEAYFESEGRAGEWERTLAGVSVDIDRMQRGQQTGDWSWTPAVTVLRDEYGVPVKALLEREQEAHSDDAFWNARPVLQGLRDFARARRVSPWAMLGCVLARVSASVSPSVVLPPLVGGDGALNLFVALCGESGSGKTAAMAAAEDFLVVYGGLAYIETGVGSGEGLIASFVHGEGGTAKDPERRMVQHNTSTLYFTDEVQGLGALGARTNSTLVPFLKSAWMGRMLATQNADRDRTRRVGEHAYRLNIVAGVQPEHAEVIFADVGGGFPQRWVWMPTYDPGRLSCEAQVAEPEPWTWNVPRPTGKVVPVSGRHVMSVPDSVRMAVWAAQEANNRPIGAKAPSDTLDGHAVFAREKVAALLALLDERAEVITEEDWDLAGQIAAKSDATRSEVWEAHRAELAREADRRAARTGRSASISEGAKDEADVARVATSLRKRLVAARAAGVEDGWVSKAVLRKTLKSNMRTAFDEAIEGLVQGTAEVEYRETEKSHGPRGTEYRLVRPAS